MTASKMT